MLRLKLIVALLAATGGLYAPFANSEDEPIAPSVGGSRLSALLGNDDSQGFPKALKQRDFIFPADHGPHPQYRNEWWYLTGNLQGENGRRFGYELTIFRFAMTPGASQSESAWRTNQVYIAHFAISDIDREEFYAGQRFSRGALELAGAQAEPFRVWVDDWQMRAPGTSSVTGAESWRVAAGEPGFAIELTLDAVRAPVLNGRHGLSQKSAEPGNASYYYSMPRWETAGSVRIGDQVYRVDGLSWLDREWGSSALAANQQGWDWFALQLDDGSDLMFYNIRTSDDSQDSHSSGTWMEHEGDSVYLAHDDVSLQVTDYWQSPRGGEYPAAWRIEIPARELQLNVRPLLADQELITTVRYWEGAVEVTGSRAGLAVSGSGYVELTGYAE